MAKFEKGDIRINRKGRPRKGRSLTEYLERALKQEREDGEKYKDALAVTLIELAIKDKNIAAIKYIFNRIDGTPLQTVELTDHAVDTKLKEIMNSGN
jgi:hypothetical protein